MSESFKKRSVCTITLLYNGYFGEGRNVNHKWLESKGFFDEYYNGRDKAVAYELDNVTIRSPLSPPILLLCGFVIGNDPQDGVAGAQAVVILQDVVDHASELASREITAVPFG